MSHLLAIVNLKRHGVEMKEGRPRRDRARGWGLAVLNQGYQGESLMPPSLIILTRIPDIPDIPDMGYRDPGPGVPSGAFRRRLAGSLGTAAAGQGYRGRGSVARRPQGRERGPT